MANNPQLSNAAASLAADAVVDAIDVGGQGYLRIYDGSQPATADTAITTQVLIATLRFGGTAFGAASNGVAAANAITSDTDADQTLTATWFRVLAGNGSTVIFDGTVGTSGCDMNLNSVTIQQHAEVAITAGSYTQSKT